MGAGGNGRRGLIVRLVGSAACCLACVGLAGADDYSWKSAVSGDFEDGMNWLPPGGPPQADDNAVFEVFAPDGYTVSFNSSPTSYALRGRQGAVTLDLNGQTWTLADLARGIIVGDLEGDLCRMGIIDGTVAARQMVLGQPWMSTASLEIKDGGAVALGEMAWVGEHSLGVLNVQAGGSLSCTQLNVGVWDVATGLVYVQGADARADLSDFLQVGDSGVGSLTISGGGQVRVGSWANFGRGVDATATVTVTGEDSRLDIMYDLAVAQDGRAAVTVSDGGRVTCTNSFVGWITGEGEVTVTGTGSAWSCNFLGVGSLGRGTLAVADGAMLTCDGGSEIGQTDTATGLVTVTGAGSRFDTPHWMAVGAGGRGALVVAGGAEVSITEWASVGQRDAGQGWAKITGAGSQWSVGWDLNVGDAPGTFGRLRVEDGGRVRSGGAIFAGRWGTARGEIVVTGPGASLITPQWIDVGFEGTGMVEVADGAAASCQWATLGVKPGSYGEMTVTGPGSTWTIDGDLNCGDMGRGKAVVADGGLVSCGQAFVGKYHDSLGEMEVRGPGARLEAAWNLHVGWESRGTLTVADGGAVECNDLCIGVHDTAAGEVAVSGPGSTVRSRYMTFVGNHSNTATLRVGDGGLVDANWSVEVRTASAIVMTGGRLAAGDQVWLDGGRLEGRGEVSAYVRGHGSIVAGGGTLAIGNGLPGGVSLWGGTPVDVMADGVLELRSADAAWLERAVTLHGGVLVGRAGIDLGGGSIRGYGVIVGPLWNGDQQIENPTGTVHLTIPVDFGDAGGKVYSVGPANMGGEVSLAGGRVEAPSGIRMNPDAVLYGHGEISGDVELQNGIIVGEGGTLRIVDGHSLSGYGVVVGDVRADVFELRNPTGTVELSGEGHVGSMTATVYSIGPATLGSRTTIEGGRLIARNGLILQSEAELAGWGRIDAAVDAASGSRIAATGDLRIGDWFAQTGLRTAGALEIGPHTVTVDSFGPVELRGRTTMDGGRLVSLSEVRIVAEQSYDEALLVGAGTVAGNVRLEKPFHDEALLAGAGTVAGNVRLENGVIQADKGSAILVTGRLSGYGVVIGDVRAADMEIAASPAGTMLWTCFLEVGDQTANVYSRGPVGIEVSLVGGTVNSPNGIHDLSAPPEDTVWAMSFGTIRGPISGWLSAVASGGKLTLGDGSRSDGIAVSGGQLRVRPDATLELLDADQAGLQGASIDLFGGVLVARNGADLRGGSLMGYGVVVGEVAGGVQSITTPTARVNLTAPLDVGEQTARVYSAGLADLGDTTMLGGRLVSPGGVRFGPGRILSGFGTVDLDVVLENAVIAADPGRTLGVGGVLYGYGVLVGDVQSGGNLMWSSTGTVDLPCELNVGSRYASVFSGGPASLGPRASLGGGTIFSPNGLVIGEGQELAGWGNVVARIAAAVGSTITVDGPGLALGDWGAVDGFYSDGILRVGHGEAILCDRNRAVLGSLTTLGDGFGGGTLSAPNGSLLRRGCNLTGYGWVNDAFHNEGYVGGEAPGGLTFTGDVTGDGEFDGEITFAGSYHPGNSPAVIPFGGSVTFTSTAKLAIELADNDNSDPYNPRYDSLRVADGVNLAGRLELTWTPIGGDPSSRFGGTYDLITYGGSHTGEFAQVVCESFGQVYLDAVDYEAAVGGGRALRITLHDLLDADTNLDGDVDFFDYLTVKAGFGKTSGAAWADGDSDMDGDVDFYDYLTAKANFGRTVGGDGLAIALGDDGVPEPATFLLLVAAAPWALRRRRSR